MKEFEDCLKRNKLVKFPLAKKLVGKEIEVAEDDLVQAKKSFRSKNYKWTIIQAYFAMFHSARALLFFKGYREKSHFCLIAAMRYLYVEKKQLDVTLVESLQMAKILRENADYENEYDKDMAKVVLVQAEQFLNKSQKITGIK